MFYSHEILTERKYGIATIWIVATLGSKQALRKISRKDILAVNISKVCKIVVNPEAPMALRLQSNLLLGIVRVHSQQFQYLYTDVSSAHSGVKKLDLADFTRLDQTIVTRPDLLLLDDDPAFVPELDAAELGRLSLDDMGMLDEDMLDVGSFPSDIITPLKFPGLEPSLGSGLGNSSSVGGGGGGDVGFFFDLSQQDPPGESGLLEDLGFEFNEEGELVDTTPKLPSAKGHSFLADSLPRNLTRPQQTGEDRLDSEDIVAQVLREHAAGPGDLMEIDGAALAFPEGDISFPPPPVEGEPFPGRPSASDKANSTEEEEAVVRKRIRKVPPLAVDPKTELSNKDIKTWNENYVENMELSRKAREADRVRRDAKSIGGTLVLDWGISGPLQNPLLQSLYSGQAIIEIFEGPKDKGKGRLKRTRKAGEPDSDEEATPKARDQVQHPKDITMQDIGMREGDDDLEIGRDAPDIGGTGGDMPWNQSALLSSRAGSVPGSAQAGHPFSAGPMPSSSTKGSLRFAELSSRPGSVSPLAPRTRRIERRSSIDRPLGDVEEEDTAGLAAGLPGDDVEEEEEFFAAGDTEGATKEALIASMERESFNFLEFLKNEQARFKFQQQQEREDEEDFQDLDIITFEQLLSPAENNRIVAAQGLHHCLLLASKGLVHLSQEEPYGEIQIGIL